MKPINRKIFNEIKDNVVELMALTDRVNSNGYANHKDDEMAVKEMIEVVACLHSCLIDLYD